MTSEIKQKQKWKLVGYLCPQCFALNKSVYTTWSSYEGIRFQVENGKEEEINTIKDSEIQSIHFEDCSHETVSRGLYDVRVFLNPETNEVDCFFIDEKLANGISKEDREMALNVIKRALNNPNLRWYKRWDKKGGWYLRWDKKSGWYRVV